MLFSHSLSPLLFLFQFFFLKLIFNTRQASNETVEFVIFSIFVTYMMMMMIMMMIMRGNLLRERTKKGRRRRFQQGHLGVVIDNMPFDEKRRGNHN